MYVYAISTVKTCIVLFRFLKMKTIYLEARKTLLKTLESVDRKIINKKTPFSADQLGE